MDRLIFFYVLIVVTIAGCRENKVKSETVMQFSTLEAKVLFEKENEKSESRFTYAFVGSLDEFSDFDIQLHIDRFMCQELNDTILKNNLSKFDFIAYVDSVTYKHDFDIIKSNGRIRKHMILEKGIAEESKYLAEFVWKNGAFFEKQEYSYFNNTFRSELYSWGYECK